MHAAPVAGAILLCAVACGPAPPDTIRRGDLARIVLARGDAPDGTVYLATVSGPSDLASFARDEPELERLRDEGFVAGHLSLFVLPDRSSPEGSLAEGQRVVQQVAGLFRRPGGADSAMLRFVDDLRVRQLPDAEVVDARRLGDRSVGLAGLTPDGAPIRMFVWRERNLILFVSVVGDMPAGDVRALADELQGRADAA